MLKKTTKEPQLEMFKTVLATFVNPSPELHLLGKKIVLNSLEAEFATLSEDPRKPHAIEYINGTDIDQAFTWDQNGNLSTHIDDIKSLNRYLCWDEENRLMAVKDQNYLSAYIYDAAGERVWKLSGEVTQMKISGKGTIDVASLSNKTLYVSPYVVYNQQGYSKHYYAGAERVSSRIGGGTLYGLQHPINDTVSTITTESGYPDISENVWLMLERSFSGCLDLYTDYIGYEPHLESVQESASQNNPETNWYIYHSDHLGSSSFLTDASGTPTQHLQYLPFGENYIEQRATTDYYTPYTFSAKERDLETGYSYFGARYYDPNVSVWLSVDPLSDKYPSMSAYMYVGGHPTMITDPDGRDWYEDENGNYVYDKNVTKDTKLKDGQTYLGEEHKINVHDENDKYLYSYNLNKDGSFSDTQGNEWGVGSTLDPNFISESTIISNKPEYNIENAVNHLNANAHSTSQKACATYVQNAIVAGGINATNPIQAAGMYGPLLLNWGFSLISTDITNYIPQKGDVAVIQGYPGGTQCRLGPCGHIQMYNGEQWVSDFFQSRPFWPGKNYETNKPSYAIYRFQ